MYKRIMRYALKLNNDGDIDVYVDVDINIDICVNVNVNDDVNGVILRLFYV